MNCTELKPDYTYSRSTIFSTQLLLNTAIEYLTTVVFLLINISSTQQRVSLQNITLSFLCILLITHLHLPMYVYTYDPQMNNPLVFPISAAFAPLQSRRKEGCSSSNIPLPSEPPICRVRCRGWRRGHGMPITLSGTLKGKECAALHTVFLYFRIACGVRFFTCSVSVAAASSRESTSRYEHLHHEVNLYAN